MRLSAFVRAYLECVLFTDNDESDESGGEPLDRNYSIEAFDEDSIARARADCEAFQTIMADDLELTGCDDEQAGHDFWFTRNGHGVGFWDRGYDKPIAERLTAMCKRFGEVWSTTYGDEDPGENIQLSEGRDPDALVARYRRVIPLASEEMDVAVECLIHRVCSVVELGLNASR